MQIYSPTMSSDWLSSVPPSTPMDAGTVLRSHSFQFPDTGNKFSIRLEPNFPSPPTIWSNEPKSSFASCLLFDQLAPLFVRPNGSTCLCFRL